MFRKIDKTSTFNDVLKQIIEKIQVLSIFWGVCCLSCFTVLRRQDAERQIGRASCRERV